MTETRALMRMLWRHRSSSLAAVAVMSCAITGAALTFAVADAALWRTLPYRDADLLAVLTTVHRNGDTHVSLPDFRAVRSAVSGMRIASAGAFIPELALTGFGEPRQIRARVLSAAYFDVLGVELAAGRSFQEDEEQTGRGTVAILTDHLWQQLFNRRDAIGATVTLNGRPHTVVGILRPYRDYLGAVDVYVPYQFSPALPRKIRLLAPVARLDPAIALPELNERIGAATHAPDDRDADGYQVIGVSMRVRLADASRARVSLLFAAGSGLLAIAVLNFTVLMRARALQRRPELMIRRALGASSARVIRLAGAEAAALCAAGALLAWLAADALLPFVARHYADGFVNDVTLGARVAAFSALIAVAAVAVAIAGAAQSFRRDIANARTVASSGLTAGRWLVVTQLALSLALVVASALLARSFDAQRRLEPGFRVDGQHATRIALPAVKYPDAASRSAFWRNLLERLEAAGLEAAIATELPLSGQDNPTNFMARTAAGQTITLKVRSVSPGYLDVMRIPVLRGRGLLATDRVGAPFTVVVNEALAAQIEHAGAAVGQLLTFDFGNGPQPARIAGVVANIRHADLTSPPGPEAYGNYEQTPLPTYSVVIRNAGTTAETHERFRAVLDTLDPGQPFAPVVTLAGHIDAAVAPARAQAGLMTGFAVSAMVVAVSGLYSVLTFLVSASRREWAIRLAIGASPRALALGILRQAIACASLAIVLGVLILAALARPLASSLYGVTLWDPLVIGTSGFLLLVVSVAAASLPARNAGRISPVEALDA